MKELATWVTPEALSVEALIIIFIKSEYIALKQNRFFGRDYKITKTIRIILFCRKRYLPVVPHFYRLYVQRKNP